MFVRKCLLLAAFLFTLFLSPTLYAQDQAQSPVGAEDASQVVEAVPPQTETVVDAGASQEVSMSSEMLNRRLKEVGSRVDTLKEDTFSTKSRLLLLREEVLRRSVSGARLVIVHKNEMKWPFVLTQVLYAVDRDPKYSKHDPSGKLDKMDDEVVFDGMMAPGSHFLTVQHSYKGNPLGIFRYMKDYSFRVESGHSFNLEEGKVLELTVSAKEGGGFFTAYEDRPSITYQSKSYELGDSATKDEKSPLASEGKANAADPASTPAQAQ